MEELCKQFKPLDNVFSLFRLETNQKQVKFPLDYIMVLPKNVSAKLIESTSNLVEKLPSSKELIHDKIKSENKRRRVEMHEDPMDSEEEKRFVAKQNIGTKSTTHYREFLKLRNVFKNYVMKKFLRIKSEKSKLTISQSVELMLKKNQLEEAKKKRKLKKKIERQAVPVFSNNEKADMLFSKAVL